MILVRKGGNFLASPKKPALPGNVSTILYKIFSSSEQQARPEGPPAAAAQKSGPPANFELNQNQSAIINIKSLTNLITDEKQNVHFQNPDYEL